MRFQEYQDRQGYQYDLNNQRPYGSQFFHYLRLIWSEQEKNSEYTLRFNTSRRGYWINEGNQRGISLLDYQFLKGFVSNVFTSDVFNFRFIGGADQIFAIHWNRSSDESSRKSHGINILRESTRQPTFLDRFVTQTGHAIRGCKHLTINQTIKL